MKDIGQLMLCCGAFALASSVPANAKVLDIKVVAGEDVQTSLIDAFGTISEAAKSLDDTNIPIGPLRTNVLLWFVHNKASACDTSNVRIYVNDPTDGASANLYSHYNWKPVSVVLQPVKAEILDVETTPVAIVTEPFHNPSNLTVTVTGGFQDTLTNEVSWSWNRSLTLGGEQTFKYARNWGFLGRMEAETKILMNGTVGESGSQTISEQIVETSSMSAELPPGGSIAFAISASRGSIKARITYKTSLSGDLTLAFVDPCAGHYHWRIPINEVLNSDGAALAIPVIDPSEQLVEDIELDYYSNISARAIQP